MKTAKKIFKIIGIIAGVVVAVLIVYIIYLYASYHRIEDNLSLEVESHAQANAYLTTEKEYSALTYNIGFGAYTPDFSFFMDGADLPGRRVRTVCLKRFRVQENWSDLMIRILP